VIASRQWGSVCARAAVVWFCSVSAAAAQTGDAPPPDVGEQIEALTKRLAEQERVNAQQQAELDAHKAREQAQAQEAQLLNEVANSTPEHEESEPVFRLYGFADAGLQRAWGGFFETGLAQSDAANFVLGNVNVYFDATPLEHVRMLTEVRFMTLPNGAERADVNGTVQRENTSIFDATSSAGGFLSIQWGSILLERAQMEWNPVDWLNLRVGYFLTPVGIWNIDHGSPTRIMLRPPLFISAYLIPERQTGVELHGTVHLLPWEVDYSAYVSNGRTFGAVDFSDDKALGARLLFKTRRPFPIQLGGSAYWGTSQDYAKMVGVNQFGQAALVRNQTIGLRELIGALDFSLDLDALRIRGEFIARRLVYEPGKREMALGAPNANAVQSSGYLLLAYQLPWLNLEPLLLGEYLRQPNAQLGEVVLAGSAGFNIYFNSALTFRFQYSYGSVIDIEATTHDHSHLYLHVLATRLVISY
jgi:hypothetical protein